MKKVQLFRGLVLQKVQLFRGFASSGLIAKQGEKAIKGVPFTEE
ncbi:MAG: hypothetical protein ACI4QJ_04775 [Candidatus Spyradenecus sp.]